MAKHKDSPGQERIDFSRGEELAMLVNLPLKRVYVTDDKGRKKLVKPRDLYDAIRAIDDHGGHGCWPSIKRLCAVSRMSRSSMIRAICALVELGLVVAEHRPYTSNRYVIQWTVVRARCERGGVVPRGNPPSSHWEPPRCPVGTITVQEPTKEPPLPARHPTSKGASKPWMAVEGELKEAGIGAYRTLVSDLQSRGTAPQDALQRLRDGQATLALPQNAGRLSDAVRGLYRFVRDGSWPCEMVTPAQAAEAAAAERARLEAARRADEARRQAEAREAAHEARLEREHGPALDALPRQEVIALAERWFPDNPAVLGIAAKNGSRSPLIRHAMLRQMETHIVEGQHAGVS